MFLMSEESFVNKSYYHSSPFMNSKYGLEQEYSLPQEYYNSHFIKYPNIKVEVKDNSTYYEDNLCMLPSKKVFLPRYIGGSTKYKYLKEYCKVTGKMNEYNEFVSSPFVEVLSQNTLMHDESNEKINSYIKNILPFLKNREQVSSTPDSVLQSTTPEPITLIHDESNKKINSYIKNILSFLKNREQVSTPDSVLQSTTPEPITLIHDESNEKINSYIKNILSFLKNREQVSIMHDESNEKLNSYIKNILSFLKNREQV